MERVDYRQLAPAAVAAMREVQRYVDHCGLEKKLLELVKFRASQINRCAYCVDMHSKDARVRRNRAAALCSNCLARGAFLQRP